MTYDVAIVGGGIVGCSNVFHLSNLGYKCVLLEKESNLVSQASSGNSGMLHTGYDAPPGSLELQCILKSFEKFPHVLYSLGLPYKELGATMVAWNSNELSQLPDIMQKSVDIGIRNIRQLSLSELYRHEQYLSPGAVGSIHIPGEAMVDPWLTAAAFAHHATLRGAKVLTDHLVESCSQRHDGGWQITTDKGVINCKMVLNCAGLYGDIVNRLAGFQEFRIKPRKGQYTVYSKSAQSLINTSILPVPNEITKGVIVFKTVYNNIIVGPTAENVDKRSTPYPIDPEITTRLKTHVNETVPALLDHQVVGMYTGTRPATETKDYHINPHTDKNWLTVGGIRSTGLSSSLGVSQMVGDMIKEEFYLEPSQAPYNSLDKLNVQFTRHGTVELDSSEYKITHPITYYGQMDTSISTKL